MLSGCRGGSPIQHTVAAWVEAWNRRDLAAMEAAFGPGGQFTGVDGNAGPPAAQRLAFQPMWGLVPDIRMRVTRWIPTEHGIAFSWAAEGHARSAVVALRGIGVVEGSAGHVRAMRLYGDVRPLLALLPRREEK